MFARILPVLLLTALSAVGFAQQESQYTSFMYNKQYFNPAAAGTRGVTSLQALYRQQWVGFEGAPTSQMISLSTPLLSESLGFGLMLNHASKGIIDNVYASMAYNYRVRLSDEHSVRIGLQGSLQRWGVDFTDESVRVRNSDDESIDLSNNFATWEGNVGFGLFLEMGNYFNFGVSVPHLYNSNISADDLKGDLGAEVTPHIYVMAEGLIPFTDKVEFKPSALLKRVQGAPLDFEANLGLVYNQRVMAGFGYRAGGEGDGSDISVLTFFQLNDKVGFGGAYDFGVSEISANTSGSFEVIGRFDFGSSRDDLVNPRFF